MTYQTTKTLVCDGCGLHGPKLTRTTSIPNRSVEPLAGGWCLGVDVTCAYPGPPLKLDFCPRCEIPKNRHSPYQKPFRPKGRCFT